MEIIKLVMGPVEANCYIVYLTGQNEAIIIDPGSFDIIPILNKLEKNNIEAKAILLTHGHFDHILGIDSLREKTGAKVYIHEADQECLINEKKNLSTYMGDGYTFLAADNILQDDDTVKIGEIEVNVIHTPGHTPGCVCFKIGDVLFTGDTLFAGSVGRTDFPNGSQEELMKSIKEKILVFDESMKIYPGHNEESSIGHEKNNNPFL